MSSREHKNAGIYDRFNDQPHIQELIQYFYYESILSPIADQAKEAFKLNNLNMKAIILGQRLLNETYGHYHDNGDLGKNILHEHWGYRCPISWKEYDNSEAINNEVFEKLESLVGKGILDIDKDVNFYMVYP